MTETPRADPDPPRRCRLALEALNFLLADVRGALGPYLNVFLLTRQGWSQSAVGVVTTVGGLAALATQTPIGAAIDAMTRKRAVLVAAAAALALAATVMFAAPSFRPVLTANTAVTVLGDVFAPSVAALTLGLYARERLAGRMGRNGGVRSRRERDDRARRRRGRLAVRPAGGISAGAGVRDAGRRRGAVDSRGGDRFIGAPAAGDDGVPGTRDRGGAPSPETVHSQCSRSARCRFILPMRRSCRSSGRSRPRCPTVRRHRRWNLGRSRPARGRGPHGEQRPLQPRPRRRRHHAGRRALLERPRGRADRRSPRPRRRLPDVGRCRVRGLGARWAGAAGNTAPRRMKCLITGAFYLVPGAESNHRHREAGPTVRPAYREAGP